MNFESLKRQKKQETPVLKTRGDFDFIKEIGEGSFSTVHLVKEKKSGQHFAIKECSKYQIIKENKTKYIHLEKRILSEYLRDHPFFVKLYFTFQDQDSLYFGLSYCSNGDLLQLIQKNKQLSLEKSQFYTAEITLALEFMHGKKIIHRDLKPENILLDENFHIKLTDFGTARIIDDPLEKKDEESKPVRRKNSFVGTAQYVSPEILNGKAPHIGTDLWALGCIVYQMLTGKHLFTGNHEYDIFQKIVKLAFTFEDNFDQLAKDLIQKLVVIEPNQRLGAIEPDGYLQLKNHNFLKNINWQMLSETNPPI
ncbi:unnamed protein product [Brachionus calyciflorus]|uniref:non-specific serine/threonine protein kinase n=1 Tax=Brachionus calyciflorus TaxID=104777 RepID=A0A813VQN4_9BILA|nr:unnamed protein product [Brachionus calyciflorus]